MCLSPADHLSCVAWVATPPWRQWNSHGKLLRNAFIKLGSTFLGSTFFCFIMKVGVDGDSEVSNLHCSPHKWKHGRAGMLRLRLSPMLCLSFSVKAVTLQFYVTVIGKNTLITIHCYRNLPDLVCIYWNIMVLVLMLAYAFSAFREIRFRKILLRVIKLWCTCTPLSSR